jgi:plastocyanin
MSRVKLLFLIAAIALCVNGCGGGGSVQSDAFVVQVQSQRVSPKTLNINSGDKVQWVNVDTISHVIESGVLEQVSNPKVLSEISIQPNGTFQPSAVDADFGDTVRWRNDTGFPFVLDIVNDANSVIASFDLDNGEVVSYNNFPLAGKYTAQKRGNVFFSGTVTLFGVPHPDGVFQSPVLPNGGTFTREFNVLGTLYYYVLDSSTSSKGFITGSVTVH